MENNNKPDPKNITLDAVIKEAALPIREGEEADGFGQRKEQVYRQLYRKLGLQKARKPDYSGKGELNAFQRIRKYLYEKYEIRYEIVGNDYYISERGKDDFKKVSMTDIEIELYEEGFTKFRELLEAVLLSDIVERQDIFLDYFFNRLPEWLPGKPDYIGQLCGYVDTSDNALFRHHLQKHLIRSIACALTYIPFNKHCLVFYGKQNDGKSSLVRFLCPQPLPLKDGFDLQQGKDARFALAQNFIINIDEMQALQKADIDKVKQYITTERVKDRIPYARKETVFWRRCSFYGTTNNEEILTDTTGNVRFIVMEISGIRHDNGGEKGYSMNIDIDNVYAQAFYHFIMQQPRDYQLNPEEIAALEGINKRFMVTTNEMDMLCKYFSPCGRGDAGCEFMTNGEIRALLEEWGGLRLSERKLGQALRFYGFERVAKRIYGYLLKRNTP